MTFGQERNKGEIGLGLKVKRKEMKVMEEKRAVNNNGNKKRERGECIRWVGQRQEWNRALMNIDEYIITFVCSLFSLSLSLSFFPFFFMPFLALSPSWAHYHHHLTYGTQTRDNWVCAGKGNPRGRTTKREK